MKPLVEQGPLHEAFVPSSCWLNLVHLHTNFLYLPSRTENWSQVSGHVSQTVFLQYKCPFALLSKVHIHHCITQYAIMPLFLNVQACFLILLFYAVILAEEYLYSVWRLGEPICFTLRRRQNMNVWWEKFQFLLFTASLGSCHSNNNNSHLTSWR